MLILLCCITLRCVALRCIPLFCVVLPLNYFYQSDNNGNALLCPGPLKLSSPSNIKAKQQQQQQQQQKCLLFLYIYVLECHATYVLKKLMKGTFQVLCVEQVNLTGVCMLMCLN